MALTLSGQILYLVVLALYLSLSRELKNRRKMPKKMQFVGLKTSDLCYSISIERGLLLLLSTRLLAFTCVGRFQWKGHYGANLLMILG